MQFVVTGRDAIDDGALARRLEARDAHIATCDVLFKSGKLLFGVALLDDHDTMVGSSMVFDTESRQELDEILAVEPYVQQHVWATVDVQLCRLGPTFKPLFDQ
jgi:uncharacterized protein